MKKVLIIASEFPPRGVGNILRTVKLVKHLPSFGWKPYVLTISERCIERFDHSYDHEIPEEACIIRAFYPNPFILLDRRWHKKVSYQRFEVIPENKESKRKVRASLKSIIKKTILSTVRLIRKKLFIPGESILWLPFAVIRGLQVCLREKIDIIYSTAPSYTNHLVGLVFKLLTGKGWMADYRDLWTGYPTRRLSPGLRKRIEEWMDATVLKKADAVNIVSPKWRDFLLRRFSFLSPEKVTCYTNGYDPEDYESIPKSKRQDGKWRITYAGSILQGYPTPLFLRAIGELCEEIPEMREEVEINFYGDICDEQLIQINNIIEKFSLQRNVFVNGRVHRQKALEIMRNSDLLLLMYIEGDLNEDGCIPAKLFEYIGAQRPIFAIVPKNGSAAEIVRSGDIGQVISPGSYKKIKDTLRYLYLRHKNNNNIYKLNYDYLRRFERSYIVGELAETLDKLTLVRR